MPAATATSVTFKIASEGWEFEQVHRLNYETFVNEIPQHAANAEQILIDRFHDQNTYFIAVRRSRVIGMLALRSRRPFSLDDKLPDLDRYLDPGRRPCEVRLLATTAESRNGFVFRGLVDSLVRYALEQGFDMALISGTPRQAKLYRHLGFVPFGPIVGKPDAPYQPMYLTLEAFQQNGKAFAALRTVCEPLNFLPGPVTVHQDVQAAFQRPAVSHRSPDFMDEFQTVAGKLCRLANAKHVHILMGSGTLANDAVAAQISQWDSPGLILSNGAFGERLIDHATRFGLSFDTLRIPWGQAFDWSAVESTLDRNPSFRWLWSVHGETSTGVLNDLARLKSITHNRGLRLAIDAVSSLGTTPIDLSGVALAAGVSGKGIGAFPGLAFVFLDAISPRACTSIPRYLDLGFYAEQHGIPFTVSSNLIRALNAALDRLTADRFAEIDGLSARLRDGLIELRLAPLADAQIFPAVTTIALPSRLSSVDVGARMERAGYLLHYRSEYLQPRNWLQICLMGPCTESMIDEVLHALGKSICFTRELS